MLAKFQRRCEMSCVYVSSGRDSAHKTQEKQLELTRTSSLRECHLEWLVELRCSPYNTDHCLSHIRTLPDIKTHSWAE